MPMHDSIKVCDKFLKLSNDNNYDLTFMHMMYMTYIAHGVTLAYCNYPLIKDKIETRTSSITIPHIYQSMSIFGSQPIKLAYLDSPDSMRFTSEEIEVIDTVYTKFKHLNIYSLQQYCKGSAYYSSDYSSIVNNKYIKAEYLNRFN